MPRPQREDEEPIIYMADTSDAALEVRNTLKNSKYPNMRFSLFEASDEKAHFSITYDALHNRIAHLRNFGIRINSDVLNCLLSHLLFTQTGKIDLPNREGLIAYKLFKPGCRVNIEQKEIATELHCSEETVRLAIKALKDNLIIVNWGKGWYEFDARYAWRGDNRARLAYLEVQRHRARLTLTDGQQTYVLNDGDYPSRRDS